ncbi:glyoxal or galactose oxidase [Haematococcus lacustris]
MLLRRALLLLLLVAAIHQLSALEEDDQRRAALGEVASEHAAVQDRHAQGIMTIEEEAAMSYEDMMEMMEENWPPRPPQPLPSPAPSPPRVAQVAALAAPRRKPPPKNAALSLASPSPPPPSPPVLSFNDDPLTLGDHSQIGIGNVVAVHMVAIPGTNRFFFMERPSGKHPDFSTVIAGYWDMDTLSFTNVNATDSLFCSGHTLTSEGDILVVGGHIAKSGYADGLKGLRIYNSTSGAFTRIGSLRAPRWYPTATLLPNNWVMITGGTIKPGSGTGSNPYYELWNPQRPGTTQQLPLSADFVQSTGDIYYPAQYILPSGHLFMFCNVYGEIFDPMAAQTLSVIPALGGNMRVFTEYPFTGTSVMLPLTPANNYTPEMVFFGGQYSYGWVNTTASALAWRIKVLINGTGSNATYRYNGWQSERMLSPRVMPDAVLLPNGQVVIINGAKRGVAGDNIAGGAAKSNEPNMWPELYTPWAAQGSRFTPLKRTLIPRLYHSVAALTVDGTVLVAGCDRCAKYWCTDPSFTPSPWGLPEYRIELFRPPAFFAFSSKPTITSVDATVFGYNEPLTITYSMFNSSMQADSAVLVAPSATTHSTNMNQRVVGLQVVGSTPGPDYTLLVQTPPNINIAPPGMYMLFLLNGQVYSRAVWVKLAPA